MSANMDQLLVRREAEIDREDAALRDSILDAFRDSGRCELRNLTVRVRHKRVVLRGTVPSYYAKQLAQATVLQMKGVEQVDNRVSVRVGEADSSAKAG